MRDMKDSGILWIGEIPKEWEVSRNKNCFKIDKTIVGPKSEQTQLLSLTTHGVIEKNRDDLSGKVPESFDTYQKVQINNLIMCLFDLDCSAVFSGLSNYQGMISPAYKVLTCLDVINPAFANYWFQYIGFDRKFAHLSKNVRFSISNEEFGSLEIVLPSLEEQIKISNFLDRKCSEIDRLISDIERQISVLENYKRSVITETVTKGLNPNVEMKDSEIKWIGEIPKDWKTVRLKDIFKFSKGLSISKADLVDEGTGVISYGQIHSKENTIHSFNTNLIRYIPEQFTKFSKNSEVETGDFIFADTSEDVEGCGNNILIDSDESIHAGYHTIVLKKRSNNNSKYLSYLFSTDLWRQQIRSKVFGVKVYSITQSLLKTLKVILPPGQEQEEIVQMLDSICEKVYLIQKELYSQIEQLKIYKKSLIFEYVTGKKEVPDE